MTSWEPSVSDICWQRNCLAVLCDGGTWIAPTTGTFVIDKKAKTLMLTARNAGYSDEVFSRITKACKAVGYEVIDKSGE